MAPALLIDCNSGLVDVLEVPGSPTEAVETFLAEVDVAELGSTVSGTTTDGGVWAYGAVREAGGAHIDYIALESDDGNSLVTITECGD